MVGETVIGGSVENLLVGRWSMALLNTLASVHWACFLVKLLSIDIFYCNLLAWLAPPNLPLKLKFLTSLIKVNYPNMQDFKVHAVNKNTEKNVFPYQEPNQNICGIACLVSVIFMTNSDIRHELRLRNKLTGFIY